MKKVFLLPCVIFMSLLFVSCSSSEEDDIVNLKYIWVQVYTDMEEVNGAYTSLFYKPSWSGLASAGYAYSSGNGLASGRELNGDELVFPVSGEKWIKMSNRSDCFSYTYAIESLPYPTLYGGDVNNGGLFSVAVRLAGEKLVKNFTTYTDVVVKLYYDVQTKNARWEIEKVD